MAKINSGGGRRVRINAGAGTPVKVNAGSGGATLELIQENRIGEWFFNEGSGQRIYNQVDPTPDDNLIATPEQNFANRSGFFTGFSGTGHTVTEGAATNPWGEASKAARLVTSSGTVNGYGITLALSAGSHTVSFYIKSNTGTSQTFRISAPAGAFSSEQTATTEWQRLSFTFTATEGNNQVRFVSNNAAGTALDVLIDGLKINVGASAGDYVRPKLDFLLGYTGAVEASDPTWNSRGIDLSDKWGTGMLASPVNLTYFTGYILAKQSKNAVKQSYALMAPYNDLNFWLKFGVGGTSDSTHSPQVRFGNSGQSQHVGHVSDDVVHLLTFQYTGTKFLLYIDGIKVVDFTDARGPVNLQRLILGSNGLLGEYFSGEMYYASIYNAVHDAGQIDAQWEAVRAIIANPRSITMQRLNKFIVFEGDSISTVKSNGLWPRKVMRKFDPIIQGYSAAEVGSQITNPVSLETRAADVDAMYDSSRAKNVLCVLIGANDLVSKDPAVFMTQLKSYCNARKATGWTLVLCTPLPRNSAGFLTSRATVISEMLADTSFYDYLVRFDTDATIGIDGSELNTTYYPDGVHPSDAGYAIMADIAYTTLLTALS